MLRGAQSERTALKGRVDRYQRNGSRKLSGTTVARLMVGWSEYPAA